MRKLVGRSLAVFITLTGLAIAQESSQKAEQDLHWLKSVLEKKTTEANQLSSSIQAAQLDAKNTPKISIAKPDTLIQAEQIMQQAEVALQNEDTAQNQDTYDNAKFKYFLQKRKFDRAQRRAQPVNTALNADLKAFSLLETEIAELQRKTQQQQNLVAELKTKELNQRKRQQAINAQQKLEAQKLKAREAREQRQAKMAETKRLAELKAAAKQATTEIIQRQTPPQPIETVVATPVTQIGQPIPITAKVNTKPIDTAEIIWLKDASGALNRIDEAQRLAELNSDKIGGVRKIVKIEIRNRSRSYMLENIGNGQFLGEGKFKKGQLRLSIERKRWKLDVPKQYNGSRFTLIYNSLPDAKTQLSIFESSLL